jgi:DNA-directed RNA polymerase specialized sigma24 family protein
MITMFITYLLQTYAYWLFASVMFFWLGSVLYRTTRNLAISQWRSGRRRQQREQAVARVEPLLECHEGDAADAQIAVNALESLSDIQREIIVLRIWGQLKLAEIAGVVDAPVSTVFHNYQQGLREIRKRLGIPCKNEND